jgi:hypothetical protein
MELLRQGSRLSVQPVTEQEWKVILALADRPAAETTSASKQRTAPRATKSHASAKRKRAAKSR